MIPILIDPWAVTFSSDDPDEEMSAKMRFLTHINEMSNEYPLQVIPFLSPEEQAELWQDHKVHFAGMRRIATYITSLSMDQESEGEPAVITDLPCPESRLSQSWLRVLATNGNTDAPPAWRFPMLFIPQTCRTDWPAVEINFRHNGNTGPNRTRNMVVIEEYENHRYFMPDIDPWRLGCIGNPRPEVTVTERRSTCRRLPRPRWLPLSIPLSQLGQETRLITDCTCGTDTHYYYLPPPSWEPTSREKNEWRNSAFIRDGVVLKKNDERETGYRDRNNHIWVWDEEEAYHWDVKTRDDRRIARVQFDGVKLRS